MQTTLHMALADCGLVLWARGTSAESLRELAQRHFPDLEPAKWLSTRAIVADRPVRGFGVEGKEAVALLRNCAGRELLASDIAIAPDLAYWSEALQLASEIVAAARFLPGLRHDRLRNVHHAVWEPVLGERDRKLAAPLAASMPSECRALSGGKDRPPRDAAATLERFLLLTVDALVRSAAATPGRGNGALPLHDRWLLALRDADSHVRGTPAELRVLGDQIEAWRRGVFEEQTTTHRLCLRMDEPETEGGPWRVAYLLQNRSDPTLLIDAKMAWAAPALRRILLASLGRAATTCPQIESSLRHQGRVPHGFDTDTGGAFAFLSETAWLLQQSGVELMLPAWWAGKNKPRLTTRAGIRPSSVRAGLRVDSLFAVDWSAALGGVPLKAGELERLAELKVPLVRMRGQWMQVDRDELLRAVERMRNGAKTLTLGEAVRLQLDQSVAIVASGQARTFFDRLHGRRSYTELKPPAGLAAALRPYQLRGYSWLHFITESGLGACLADDMALGKTIQTLSLILHAWRESPKRPVLLVCPTSVIGNWVREAQRFTPGLPIVVHHGAERSRDAAFKREVKGRAMVVTSYALMHRDAELFKTVKWRGIVLDEAQNIKSPESKQAQAARSLEAEYRVALTGTPVENHVGDLWSLMEFLNPGLLGSHSAFKRRFLIPIGAMHDRDAADRLRSLTSPFILRRLKTDPTIVPDLPAKNEMKVFCTLTREQASLYAAVLREYEQSLDEAEGIQRRGRILAMLSKLKQVCNHPAHFSRDASPLADRSGKLARLEEMLEEVLDVDERALIFTQFAEMGALLERRLTERFAREVLFLHGGVAKRRRDEMIESFATQRGPALFVLSLKAGGTGLNLTRANHVFHFDRWWNPAVENQATDRAFRIGQTKIVQVHKFICAGTLEERIDALIESKRGVADAVVSGGEQWLTELSSAQLHDLVALSSDSVEA